MRPRGSDAREVAVPAAGATLMARGRIGPSVTGVFGGSGMRKRKQEGLSGILALLGPLTSVTNATAGGPEGDVHDRRGSPVADAVVTVVVGDHAMGQGRKAPVRPSMPPRVIDQKALAFTPYVEVFRPG